MRFKTIFSTIILSASIFFSCKKAETSLPEQAIQIEWANAQNYYLKHITAAIKLLDTLEQKNIEAPETKTLFFDIRKAFKKAEPYAGALNPDITHRSNGPALPIYNDDSGRIVDPIGLQKLEETIFSEEPSQENLKRDVYFLKGFFSKLKNNISNREVTPKRFFIATHQQLMRLVSLSMSGFDTPITGNSIKETAISLKSLEDIYVLTLQPLIQGKNKNLDSSFLNTVKNAIKFIGDSPNIETFDRFTFIKNHLNPITRNWVKIRQESNAWDGKSNAHPFNFDAPTFFEANSFNTNFFLDVNDRNPSEKKISLVKKLFFDKNLSQKSNMSCATCHVPEKAYADGLKLSFNNEGNPLKRNTPTLLNSIYQKAFFWDGRANTIENQINSVFTNQEEFNTEVHQFSGNILKDSSYVRLFKEAFGTVPRSNRETVRAISIFVATLNGFNSKFDKNIRGEINTFTAQEKYGFNLFMGKALCATCHFIPLTNGTVPPYFNETEKEVIGVPKTKNNKEIDSDRGFYWVYEEDLHDKMFKTPTIRNIEHTAPYMHNGVYKTLAEVMDFYTKGGGAGLGFDVPHQTLPFDNLDLSKDEQQAIIAFMKTLNDNEDIYIN